MIGSLLNIGRSIQIFSFFSGCGFLDLGFEDAGFNVSFVNEFNKEFLRAYRYARRSMGYSEPCYGYFDGSIEKFLLDEQCRLFSYIQDAKNAGSLVGFIGGPPCPDFSVGGKNRGREGSNGKLSRTYVELIIKHQPDFFLFENVKGLWKTKTHRLYYNELKALLEEAGYVIADRLINAIEYGVPQDRARVIMFGLHKKHTFNCDAILHEFPWSAYMQYPGRTAFEFNWPTQNPFGQALSAPSGIPLDLTVQYWFEKNKVMEHPNTNHYFQPRAGLTKFLAIDEGDDSKKSYKRLHRWRYSPTACYGNNEVHLHPCEARRISVAEALAIQSLPEKFILPADMTLTDMFKTIGNGVPYLAAYGIANSILKFLRENDADISLRDCASN